MKCRTVRILAFVAAIWTLVCRPARADPAAGPVAVVAEGPGSKELRLAVLKALPPELSVVDAGAFRLQLVHAGLVRGVGTLDAKSIRALRRAAVAAGAKAIVVARVVRVVRTSRTLRLAVIDVEADPPRIDVVTLGPKPAEDDSQPIGAALGGAFDAYLPPPPAPAAAEPPPPDPAPPAEAAEAPPGPAPASPARGSDQPSAPAAPLTEAGILELAIGPELGARTARYRNGLSTQPYTPSATGLPGGRVSGQVYPFAASGRVWGNLGLRFDYEQLLISSSATKSLRDATLSYSLGLRGRLRLGGRRAAPPVALGVSASYAFSWSASMGPVYAEMPATRSRTIRPAVDVRVPFGRLSLFAEAGFRVLADPGSIAPSLLGPHGYGFDGNAGAGLLFGRHVEARLIARYEAYMLGLTPPSGTTVAAGKIFDQRFGAIAAVAVLL